ncbi:MAG: ketol-acid reductoisomerase, partial [Clostridia bacterium]|nr:ketol-acid reductoisomerase [Clostridia bacterium]
AEFGEYVSGPRVLPYEQTKANMRAVLQDIQDGTFAGRWMSENRTGRCYFNSRRGILARHQMEVVGEQLRSQMLWKNDNNLDNAST